MANIACVTHKIVLAEGGNKAEFDAFATKLVALYEKLDAKDGKETLLAELVKEAAEIRGEEAPDFDLRAFVESIEVRAAENGEKEIIIEESACWDPKGDAWNYAMSVHPDFLYAWNSVEYGNREFLRYDPNDILTDDENFHAFFLVNDDYDGEDDAVDMFESYATEKELVERVNALYGTAFSSFEEIDEVDDDRYSVYTSL